MEAFWGKALTYKMYHGEVHNMPQIMDNDGKTCTSKRNATERRNILSRNWERRNTTIFAKQHLNADFEEVNGRCKTNVWK